MTKQGVWQRAGLAVCLSGVLAGCGCGAEDSKDSQRNKQPGDGAAVVTAATAPGVPLLEGVGTAQVDGVLSAGEWDGAGVLQFDAHVPAFDGGTTVPATLLAMHDDTNLYLAVRLHRPAYGGATQPIFEFDNDNDGILFEPGDDIVHMFVGEFSPAQFLDVFRYPCPGSEDPTFAGCSARDVDDGGTADGGTAAGTDGSDVYIELAHPLDGADDAHDFSLAPGAAVGFQFTLHLFSLEPSCNFAPECVADTYLTAAFRVAGGNPPPPPPEPQRVVIDVMPGSDVNPVNLASMGVIPIAILGSATFDAAAIDAGQVCFGDAEDVAQRDCTEAHGRSHVADVNADGYADAVLHYETRETGIDAGDTRACASVATPAGTVEACDAIRTESGP